MKTNRKQFLGVLLVILLAGLLFIGCEKEGQAAAETGAAAESAGQEMASPLAGDGEQEYYMVTFVSTSEYWHMSIKGWKDAGKLYNVKAIYTGTPEYDLDKAITTLEQVIAKNPAGIAMPVMNDEAYVPVINKAIEQGIPVVTYNADAPKSDRYSYLGSSDYQAGVTAAHQMAEAYNERGDVALVFVAGQSNHELLAAGFRDTINGEYPNMTLVQEGNDEGSQEKGASIVAGMMQVHPNLKGVFITDTFGIHGGIQAIKEAGKVGQVQIVADDRSRGTLDAIGEGTVLCSVVQDGWSMGFWSLQFLYQLHNNLVNPVIGWDDAKINPVPPYVDCGLNIITKDNYEKFYIDPDEVK